MPSRNARREHERREAETEYARTEWMEYAAISAFTITVFVAAMTFVVYGIR